MIRTEVARGHCRVTTVVPGGSIPYSNTHRRNVSHGLIVRSRVGQVVFQACLAHRFSDDVRVGGLSRELLCSNRICKGPERPPRVHAESNRAMVPKGRNDNPATFHARLTHCPTRDPPGRHAVSNRVCRSRQATPARSAGLWPRAGSACNARPAPALQMQAAHRSTCFRARSPRTQPHDRRCAFRPRRLRAVASAGRVERRGASGRLRASVQRDLLRVHRTRRGKESGRRVT